MLPRGVLAVGDANEKDLALADEMRAGPTTKDGLVGPTLDADVSVKLRYQGLTESKWWATVNENREEEHDPILAVDDGLNRREEARG